MVRILLFFILGQTPAPDSTPAPARITVQLPPGAKLFVDGVAVPGTSTARTIKTPALPPGKDFFYNLKAEFEVDGKKFVAERRIQFQANNTQEIDFRELAPAPKTPMPPVTPPVTPPVEKPAPKPLTPDIAPKPPVKEDVPALNPEERDLFEATNREREKNNKPALRINAKLMRSAQEHSANMAKQDVLEHVLDMKNPGDRLKEVGYDGGGWGENVASGQRTAAEVVQNWMDSPGHRANILNDTFTEIGLGIGVTRQGVRYYTQVFGRPRLAN